MSEVESMQPGAPADGNGILSVSPAMFEQFRIAFESVATAMAFVSLDGIFLHVNQSLLELVGYTEAGLVGRHYREITHPDDVALSKASGDAARQGVSPSVEFEKRYVHADGHIVWVNITTTVVRDEGGKPLYQVTHMHDITSRKQTEAALHESEERFRSAFDDASIGMAIISLDRERLRVNAALCELTGYNPDELIGESGAALSHPDDSAEVAPLYDQIFRGVRRSFESERRVLHRDGSVLWCSVNIAAVHDSDGQLAYLLAQIQDLTERKMLEQRLQYQAFHDILTGLPNRALLVARLEAALTECRHNGGHAGLLFLDLDNFKVVNDSLGHVAGDALLVEVSRRLKECVQEDDTVSRLGGDEFAILLCDSDPPARSVAVAQCIVAAFEQPFTILDRLILVTTSVGVVVADGADSSEDLLRQADVAMYRAKGCGKNQIKVFDSEMQANALRRLDQECELRRALLQDEFVVYYQPKVALPAGRIEGVEALVRWQHPERGIVLPDEFVPLAEEIGLSTPLGYRVLRLACAQMSEWIRTGFLGESATLSVNLSNQQFLQPELVQEITSILTATGLSAGNLTLEITETALMGDADDAPERLMKLASLGVGISIDDFGTGYSSLGYLRRFPVNVLKIDRSFVSGLGVSREDTAIVTAIISLAHSLGILATGEGVETQAQAEHLTRLGCDRAQGFYFARPMEAARIERVLRRGTLPSGVFVFEGANHDAVSGRVNFNDHVLEGGK